MATSSLLSVREEGAGSPPLLPVQVLRVRGGGGGEAAAGVGPPDGRRGPAQDPAAHGLSLPCISLKGIKRFFESVFFNPGPDRSPTPCSVPPTFYLLFIGFVVVSFLPRSSILRSVLLRDIANPNPADRFFPLFRTFDWCAHRWTRLWGCAKTWRSPPPQVLPVLQ